MHFNQEGLINSSARRMQDTKDENFESCVVSRAWRGAHTRWDYRTQEKGIITKSSRIELHATAATPTFSNNSEEWLAPDNNFGS